MDSHSLLSTEAGPKPQVGGAGLCLPTSPETPLTQPDVPLEGHEHVAGFQVPVDDLLAMKEGEGFQHLAANHLNLGLGEASVQLCKQRGEHVSSASVQCRQLQSGSRRHRSTPATNVLEPLLYTRYPAKHFTHHLLWAHSNPMGQAQLLPHFTGEETDAQRSQVTCSGSHSRVTDLRLKTASWASELRFTNTTLLKGRDPFREQVLRVRLRARCRVSERHGNDEQCFEHSGRGGEGGQQPLLPGESGGSPEEEAFTLCPEGRTDV